mmetsp:Transcript_35198/g.76874  ORF Transcript_35198/g.76874 Transcript_35198/m.76874 type:complete len:426 (+) Transcript_35198:68-1345(+)
MVRIFISALAVTASLLIAEAETSMEMAVTSMAEQLCRESSGLLLVQVQAEARRLRNSTLPSPTSPGTENKSFEEAFPKLNSDGVREALKKWSQKGAHKGLRPVVRNATKRALARETSEASRAKKSSPSEESVPSKTLPVAPVAPVAAANKTEEEEQAEFANFVAMPETLSGTLESQMDSFKGSLEGIQKESLEAIAQQKATYERKMKQQEKENAAILVRIANATLEIKKLDKAGEKLKVAAEELQAENDALRASVRLLQQNITTANDFAKELLEAADDSESKELQVLRDAAKAKAEESKHSKILESPGLALLQTGRKSPSDVERDAMQQLSQLRAGVSSLLAAQNKSLERLKESFLGELKQAVELHDELSEKEYDLQRVKAVKKQFNEQMGQAVNKLKDTRSLLQDRHRALKLYLQQVVDMAASS